MRCTYIVFVPIGLVLHTYIRTFYMMGGHCVPLCPLYIQSTLAQTHTHTHCNVCQRTVCNSACISLSCALTSCTFLPHTYSRILVFFLFVLAFILTHVCVFLFVLIYSYTCLCVCVCVFFCTHFLPMICNHILSASAI